jgi:hypothetical protein
MHVIMFLNKIIAICAPPFQQNILILYDSVDEKSSFSSFFPLSFLFFVSCHVCLGNLYSVLT